MAELNVGTRDGRYFYWDVNNPSVIGELALNRTGGETLKTNKYTRASKDYSIKHITNNSQKLADFIFDECHHDVSEITNLFQLVLEKANFKLHPYSSNLVGKNYHTGVILPQKLGKKEKQVLEILFNFALEEISK